MLPGEPRRFDLVILDQDMPDLTGDEALEVARVADAERTLEKPIDLKQLIETVKELL
jgi:hypothetical protein